MKPGKTIRSTVLALLVLCLAVTAAAHENSRHRPERELNRYEKVKKAMSVFLFGMQHEMPGIILGCYQPKELVSEKDGSGKYSAVTSELEGFFNTFTATGGKPIVSVLKSRITWEGEEAVVECTLSWNVRDLKAERDISYQTDEVFRLLPKDGEKDGKFVIKEAVTTPVVFRFLADEERFRDEMEKTRFAGGAR